MSSRFRGLDRLGGRPSPRVSFFSSPQHMHAGSVAIPFSSLLGTSERGGPDWPPRAVATSLSLRFVDMNETNERTNGISVCAPAAQAPVKFLASTSARRPQPRSRTTFVSTSRLIAFQPLYFFFFPISRLVFGYSLIQRGNIAFCVAHVFTSSNKISYSIICYLISIDIPLYHFPPPLSGTRTRESVPRIVDRDYSRSPGVPGCVTKTFGSIGCFYDK